MALQNSSISEMQLFLAQSFLIPNYQREYSWETPELEDFWHDLEDTNREKDDVHFFGQVVVHNDTEARKKYIIDGQQRTTTSMIFLRSMQNFFEDIYFTSGNNLKQADYKRSDIESKFLGREGERHLVLGKSQNDFFEKNILSQKPDSIEKTNVKSHERLRKAYQFFNERLKELLDKESDNEARLDILLELYDTFTTRFSVLYMEATKLEEAFIIFETLNARGKDLETSDLLKNYILNQSKNVESSLVTWDSMIKNLERCDPTKFIRAFWNATFSFSREKELYRSINKNINTPRKTKEFLDDLEELSPYYHDMCFPMENNVFKDDDLISSLRSLKLLKATTFYPVVLAMKKRKFSEEDIAKAVNEIETLAFRNFTICGKTANTAEVVFSTLARDICEDSLDSVADVTNAIKVKMVSDDEFQEGFMRWAGSKTAKDTIRYIFRKIHKHLDKTNELNVDNMDVHIEHIMPEDNSKWKVQKDVHEANLWKIGNLCLLSGPLNQGASNDVISVRLPYYAESKIEPNKNIKDYLVADCWTEESINKRQCYFSQLALDIWKK